MLELSHFTVSELPGTAAIWLAGIGSGAAAARYGLRTAAVPFALLAAMAALSMIAEGVGWPAAVRVGIDTFFLVAVGAEVALIARGASERRA